MPTKERSPRIKKHSSRRNFKRTTSAQRKNQEHAKKAMLLFKSGKTSSLKKAWAKVKASS
jgi:hypothetical protein